MKFEDYIEKLKKHSVGVIGIGVSNTPLINTFLKYGIKVTAYDKRSFYELDDRAKKFAGEQNVELVLGNDYLDNLHNEILFRTPGLMPFEEHLQKAAAKGCTITSEMEAFFEVCPCHTIAVTGSDGKTTTTTIINELLKQEGYITHIGGNIGNPLFSEASQFNENDYAVLELSSFQLHSMKCAPEIAVITNISPNHLDKHKDFQDYIDAKKNIFINQNNSDTLILNANDAMTDYYQRKASSKIHYFARDKEINNGIFSFNGEVYASMQPREKRQFLLNTDSIIIPGSHNIENYLAAFAATYGLISNDTRLYITSTFKGVEHRLEKVRELNGVTFINDSIGTSPTRTIAGIRAVKTKPILIAGGYDKHIPFDGLGDVICKDCKALILTGDTSEKIYKAVTNSKYYTPKSLKIEFAESLKDAVIKSCSIAEKGDIVLLSPACAAFDRYKNFMERGKDYKNIINSL
jgi:UDP-N-acetylmuramoylalanine--D-glutamate ligase